MPDLLFFPKVRRDKAVQNSEVDIYFSDFFGIRKSVLDRYGAFDISLVNDLPLFIDPFLLFNSRKPKYRHLHEEIIKYLSFLRDRSLGGGVDDGFLKAHYTFKEIHQNWLGFSKAGNRGSGLGMDFARALNLNLHTVFSSFGNEDVTRGSHLEKLCLIGSGVGRDHVSDFTANLIKGYLLDYTQTFAIKHIAPELRKKFAVEKVVFNYETESWQAGHFDLPSFRGEYVILTPRDVLTREDIWINKPELVARFDEIVAGLENASLRAQLNGYLKKRLGKKPRQKEINEARVEAIRQYPAVIEHYIKQKEEDGDRATAVSADRVHKSELIYIEQVRPVAALLQKVGFYDTSGTTYDEAHQRIDYFKDCIENKGGHKIFYVDGEPIRREEDVHILFRLIWYGTSSDVSREVNDGRGPVDFKISRGAADKTLVEFKLASNSQLKRNLENQAEIYQKASDARRSIKVIVYRSAAELRRMQRILKGLKLIDNPDIVMIDARKDNKPSGSKA
jgi:hypothetical protein